MRWLEFSGKRAHKSRKNILNTQTPLTSGWRDFCLGRTGYRCPQCQELGLVNLKWSFCFCNLWMNAGEDMMFGLVKASVKSQFSMTMWWHCLSKTFNICLNDFQALCVLIQLPIPSLHVISCHPIPSYHIPFLFIPSSPISFHYFPQPINVPQRIVGCWEMESELGFVTT